MLYQKIQLVKQPSNPSPHTIAAVHTTRKDPPHASISDTNDCCDTLGGHSAVKNMPDPLHTLALAGNFLDLTMTTWKYTLHNVLNHRSGARTVLWCTLRYESISHHALKKQQPANLSHISIISWAPDIQVLKWSSQCPKVSHKRRHAHYLAV